MHTHLGCMRRYAFEYPSGWKVETVGKVCKHESVSWGIDACDMLPNHPVTLRQNEKGMQGIDSRVRNTRIKGGLHVCAHAPRLRCCAVMGALMGACVQVRPRTW